MAGPREQSVRSPAAAGTFYPADPIECAALAQAYVRAPIDPSGLMSARGAMLPHAGWICSGAIAGEAVGALAQLAGDSVDLVVVFGAVHTPIDIDYAALDSHAVWRVPGADAQIADEISRSLIDEGNCFVVDERMHRHEHAVEVELPFVHAAWPSAMVLPIEVPLAEAAVDIGERVARRVQSAAMRAVYLASSDLTHYGPAYQFAPGGVGVKGLEWAKRNDRRLLRVMTDEAPERVVPEVRENRNACGGGAIAAMLSACRVENAVSVRVLRHVNSFETLAAVAPQRPTDAVGYAAVIVGSAESRSA